MTKYRKGPQKTTKEAAGNWHQLKSMVPYIPMHAKFFKTHSFTPVFILRLLGTHYSLICIVIIFDLRNKNNCYVISITVTTT